MKKIAYIRIPPLAYRINRQANVLKKYGINVWYIERVGSASSDQYAQLHRILQTADQGDCIHIYEFAKIARSAKDLLDILEIVQLRQLQLKSFRERFDSQTQTGQDFFIALKHICEFERSNILEQSRTGFAESRFYAGENAFKISPADFKKQYIPLTKARMTKSEIANILGISRETMYKIINQLEREKGRYE